MWYSLVWKEWREQRWKMAFGCALLAGFTFIGLRTRVMPDDVIVEFSMMIGGLLLPLIVSMGLIAPGRADGSLARLLALPVPAWHVLAAKAAVGLAVVAAPVLVAAALALLIAGGRELSAADLLGMYAITMGIALATFTWMTATSIRQPSEARAGLVGIAVFAAWSTLLFLAGVMGLGPWALYVSPFAFSAASKGGPSPGFGPLVVAQVGIMVLLWAWAARRLARPVRGGAA